MWHDPDDRLQKAVDRFDEGDVDTARRMLRALDRQGVLSPRIDVYLGHCHLEADRPEAALKRYRRAAAVKPDEASAWVGIALCHGRLGQVDRAVGALQRAAALDPDREDVHCHLVHCHALLGRLAEAEAHARRARRLDPTCPHVHRHLAVAYLLADRPAAALACWARVLSRAPDHPEAPVGRGRCLAALGRRAEARVQFLAGVQGPYAADALYGLGDIAWSEERLEAALEHFRSAALRDPEHVEARLRWARCLTELGRFEEALPVLEPLLLQAGDDGEVVGVTAAILRARGARSRALRLLRALVARRPRSSEAWRQLGEHLLEGRRFAVATSCLRRAWRLEQDDPEVEAGSAARALARALARQDRLREAVQVLASAAHDHAESVELHMDLAAAQLAAGRTGAAERGLLRALESCPQDAGLWAAAAELSLEAGRMEQARERLRWALRCRPRHGHALALLVRWLLSSAQPLKAVHAARAAARVLPAGHPVVRDLGHALLRLGRAEEALLPLRRYVLAAPGDVEGYRLLAHALDLQGDPAAAATQRRLLAAVPS